MHENILDIEVEVGKVYTFTHKTMGEATIKVTHVDSAILKGVDEVNGNKKFYGMLIQNITGVKQHET